MSNSPSNRSLYFTFAGLLALLAATMANSFILSGAAGMLVGLTIAVLKACLVLMIFMNLRSESGAVRLAAAAGVLWLSLAMIGVAADYRTRGLNEIPQGGLRETEHVTSYDRVDPDRRQTSGSDRFTAE